MAVNISAFLWHFKCYIGHVCFIRFALWAPHVKQPWLEPTSCCTIILHTHIKIVTVEGHCIEPQYNIVIIVGCAVHRLPLCRHYLVSVLFHCKKRHICDCILYDVYLHVSSAGPCHFQQRWCFDGKMLKFNVVSLQVVASVKWLTTKLLPAWGSKTSCTLWTNDRLVEQAVIL